MDAFLNISENISEILKFMNTYDKNQVIFPTTIPASQ